jgi:hypothetical protein
MKKHIILALALLAAIALVLIAARHGLLDDLRPRPSGIAATPPPAAPAFTPDPEVLAFATTVLSQRPWLEARSSDANVPPGAAPATTFIVSRVEPVIAKDGDTWKITFKTPTP